MVNERLPDPAPLAVDRYQCGSCDSESTDIRGLRNSHVQGAGPSACLKYVMEIALI